MGARACSAIRLGEQESSEGILGWRVASLERDHARMLLTRPRLAAWARSGWH